MNTLLVQIVVVMLVVFHVGTNKQCCTVFDSSLFTNGDTEKLPKSVQICIELNNKWMQRPVRMSLWQVI